MIGHRMTRTASLYSQADETRAWTAVETGIPVSVTELAIDGSRKTEQLLGQSVTHTMRTSTAASTFANGMRLKLDDDDTEYEVVTARTRTLPAPGHTELHLTKRSAVIA